MQSTNKTIKITLIGLFYLAHQSDVIASQREQPIEERKCASYKKDIYTQEITFGAFMHDTPEFIYYKDTCKSVDPFIAGGTPAKPKEFPLVARLGILDESDDNNNDSDNNKNNVSNNDEQTQQQQVKIKWFCAGTLISEKFVLTAAHCFYSTFGEVNRVRLGELDFSTDTDDADPEDFLVQRYIAHPKYNDNLSYNDIGLIELHKSVKFNTYKHPACLPVDNSNSTKRFLAIGWGQQGYFGSQSDHLLKVGIDRFAHDLCNELSSDNGQFEKGIDTRAQICAGSMNSNKDTCPGDSGGPLLAYHNEYQCLYYVVGITSVGISGCGYAGVPGVYTDVYNYLDWIKEYIWK